MSFFGQAILQDSKAGGVHSYFSSGDNDARTKPTVPQHALQKSSPGGLSAYTDGRIKKANLSPLKLKFDDQQKPIEVQVFND